MLGDQRKMKSVRERGGKGVAERAYLSILVRARVGRGGRGKRARGVGRCRNRIDAYIMYNDVMT